VRGGKWGREWWEGCPVRSIVPWLCPGTHNILLPPLSIDYARTRTNMQFQFTSSLYYWSMENLPVRGGHASISPSLAMPLSPNLPAIDFITQYLSWTRKYFFSQVVDNVWNKLPQHVDAPSVNSFKSTIADLTSTGMI